ncbi:MAG TPA: class I SAM-dependent methyltransferase [Actinomycetota bacterium]|nr:class I SAM-dependent methyltransferase [Actinomycetota bacterium]
MSRIEELDRRYYPGYVDEHVRFDALIRSYLRPGIAVLDAGAGRGVMYPNDYATVAARVAGADTDPAVLENESLTDAVVADLASLPYEDASFDLIFSKYVFEHLDRPVAVLRELRRVLRPGGHLLIHTPNRWHYVALFATVTPTRFHAWYQARRGRPEIDTFPTRYRANDPARLERLAMASRFRVVSIQLLETKPDYLYFSPIAYRAGIVYERAVNRWDALARFRVQLIADLEAV